MCLQCYCIECDGCNVSLVPPQSLYIVLI
uniref:Uncharacterized protein n=1 Tax=Rhizophora mucronata TaxID=61149 RepID=A0A2P2KVI5_RHIMU